MEMNGIEKNKHNIWQKQPLPLFVLISFGWKENK